VSNEKRRQHINSLRSMEIQGYFSPENLKYDDIEPIREIEYRSELTVHCKESPKSYDSDGDRYRWAMGYRLP
jgi:hypothetical protein